MRADEDARALPVGLQVSVHCFENGSLLALMWHSHAGASAAVTRRMHQELCGLRAERDGFRARAERAEATIRRNLDLLGNSEGGLEAKVAQLNVSVVVI